MIRRAQTLEQERRHREGCLTRDERLSGEEQHVMEEALELRRRLVDA